MANHNSENMSACINVPTFGASLPYGGYKQSGLGREGGIEGTGFFETKTIHMTGPDA